MQLILSTPPPRKDLKTAKSKAGTYSPRKTHYSTPQHTARSDNNRYTSARKTPRT